MSVQALTWVLEHSEARLGARLVLIVLADHAHANGTNAFPSVETIAKEARMTSRAVHAALRRLEQDGDIGRTGKRQSGTIVYAIPGVTRDDVSSGGEETTDVADAARGEGYAQKASSSSPEPLEPIEPSSKKLGRNESVTTIDEQISLAFDVWADTLRYGRSVTLTDARHRAIGFALRSYSVQQLADAFEHVSYSLTEPDERLSDLPHVLHPDRLSAAVADEIDDDWQLYAFDA